VFGLGLVVLSFLGGLGIVGALMLLILISSFINSPFRKEVWYVKL